MTVKISAWSFRIDRRAKKELAKVISKYGEESKIAIRSIRREAMKH